jgi:hypothetical protein
MPTHSHWVGILIFTFKNFCTMSRVDLKQHQNLEYNGVFSDFQTFGNNFKGKRYYNNEEQTVMSYEKDVYSERQNFLFRKALKGLHAYDLKEVKKMRPDQIQRIKKINAKALSEINILKQEKLIEITNAIFSIFHNSPFAKGIVKEFSEPHKRFRCEASWKELGITKAMVIERLVDKKILPHEEFIAR